ncbi:hypothetical protein SDC9_150680 [bioreactor metagenome]|uniref:Uncharacterized protein n=1 Tax=bioreactor metagenome TaxID=1076179 RepID=A0A645EQ18_9ZZZZ
MASKKNIQGFHKRICLKYANQGIKFSHNKKMATQRPQDKEYLEPHLLDLMQSWYASPYTPNQNHPNAYYRYQISNDYEAYHIPFLHLAIC